jgi:hypothetical protein
MTTLEHIGSDEVSNRELYLIDAAEPQDVSAELSLTGRYFVCLLAWDASASTDEAIKQLARRLLAAGCVYVCCWGSECERVHDLFDKVDGERSPGGPWAISTWHQDEPLSEALWFTLFNTYPDSDFFDDCRSAVGIAVGSSEWAGEIRGAMADPRAFNARVVRAD